MCLQEGKAFYSRSVYLDLLISHLSILQFESRYKLFFNNDLHCFHFLFSNQNLGKHLLQTSFQISTEAKLNCVQFSSQELKQTLGYCLAPHFLFIDAIFNSSLSGLPAVKNYIKNRKCKHCQCNWNFINRCNLFATWMIVKQILSHSVNDEIKYYSSLQSHIETEAGIFKNPEI